MNKKDEKQLSYSITPLTDVMNTLLGPDGCPWDRQQDHRSLRKNLLEEAHEVVETIDQNDLSHMQEELGDLLLQIVFHAKIAENDGHFNFNDVVAGITEKLIRRHPHIFAQNEAIDANQVLANWEQIKLQEKGDEEASVMSKLPPTLPALMEAEKIQSKAHRVGFDWPDISGPWEKLHEEIGELQQACAEDSNKEEELGDVLFSVVNLARFLKIDPERALKLANKKFITRFKYIESKAKLDKRAIEEYTINELDRWWSESKG